MITSKVVIFGAKQSGKQALMNYIRNPGNPLDPVQVQSDLSCLPTSTNIPWGEGKQLQLFHLRNDSLDVMNGALPDSQLGIYCINLSCLLDYQQIGSDIGLFQAHNPNAPLYVVGTFSDRVTPEVLQEFRNLSQRLPSTVEFQGTFEVSAQTKEGLQSLHSQITHVIPQIIPQNDKSVPDPKKRTSFDNGLNDNWMESTLKLVKSGTQLHRQLVFLATQLEKVSEEKKQLIGYTAYVLVVKLLAHMEKNNQDEYLAEKIAAIDDFEKSCKLHLEVQYPVLRAIGKTVAAIAVTATVLVLVTAFFMAGVALSLCTAGLLPVIAAAATAAVLAGTAGGLTAYGLFKKSPMNPALEQACREVATCARGDDPFASGLGVV